MLLKKYINQTFLFNFSFYKVLKLFINLITKLRFDLPTKSKYLIIDINSKALINIFSLSGESLILKNRQEEFNFWIILYSLPKLASLKLSDMYVNYLKSYILYIKPELIMTSIHNNPVLWNISEGVKSKFYIFQNGYCSPTDPLPKRDETSRNVIFFTLTKERSNLLKTFGLNAIPFGSYKSNSIAKSKSKTCKRIVFVSQFRYMNDIEKRSYSLNNLSYEQTYSYDYSLLEIVCKFTEIHNLELIFMGSSRFEKNIENEKRFFKLQNRNVKYLKRFKSFKEQFDFLDQSHMIVGIDSALLYECLGRDIKTFFCSCRGYKEFNYSVRPFLESLPNNGFGEFWTNKYDKELILNILTNMHLNISKTKPISKIYDEVPYYNPINLNQINKLLKQNL